MPASGMGGSAERPLVLPARQLVPQRSQRLIRGKRAGGLCLRLGWRPGSMLAAATTAVVASLGLGPPSLGDLRLVRLVPRPGLGVLLLPLLALLLVPLEPFLRLGVEALGIDVVALVVVGGRHAVQGRGEVLAGRLGDRALVP